MPSSGYRKQTMDFGEMSRDLQSAAASFTKMSAAAAGFVSLVGAFKTFELEVTRANSAIGGSAKTYKQLSDAARNFALISKYSAGEAAGSMVMLAQAGFDAQETMAAMPHVLQLAQASMENLDLVADTVASTIRTFNMSADEAARVTNVFAASCVNSLATVNKLAFSFRQVGPVAAELGMNVEQTAAALDVLYNRGLRGEQAGTALRNILIRLIKPTQDTLVAFSNLGIGLKNADGSARDLQAILSDLRKANISDTYLAKIFGREALAASKTLIAATTGEYDRMKDSITDTNTVARMANAQMNTLDGALKLIKNSLNEVGIILGQSVGPLVKQVGSAIQDLAIYLRSADSSTISLIKNFGSFVAFLGSAKFGITKLLGELGKLVSVGDKVYSTASLLKKGGSYALGTLSIFGGNTLTRNTEIMTRLKEITENNKYWNSAYNAMNEYYKKVTGGAELTRKLAMQARLMTSAQYAQNKALMAGAAAWDNMKKAAIGFSVAAGKLLLILVPLMLAFKAYDSYMKERERKEQRMADMFPELEYLDQKIKGLKATVTTDLPSIARKYKDIMDQIATIDKTQARTNITGVSFAEGQALPTEQFDVAIKAFSDYIKSRLRTSEGLSKEDAYKFGKQFGLDYDVMDTILQGVDDTVEASKTRINDLKTQITSSKGGLLVGLASALLTPKNLLTLDTSPEKMTTGGLDALDEFLEANAKVARKLNEDRLVALKEARKTATDFAKELTSLSSESSWLFKNKNTSADSVKRIKEALANFLGIPTDKKDFDVAVREGVDALQQALQKYEGDTTKILEDFKKSDFFKGLSTSDKEAIISGKAEITGEIKVTPLNVAQQESALEALRKTVSDMVSDYRITWELMSAEQVASERLNKLENQYNANRKSTLNEQKDLIQKIYDLTQNEAFSVERLEGTLGNVDITTGKWLEKERLLAAINQNKDPNVRKMASLYLEQVELKGKELLQQNKLLDKDRERLELINGQFKYQKEYTEELIRQIELLDKQATVGGDYSKNFKNGMHAGLLEVQKEIDSVYKMGKKGMQGFADYLSDSMYGVIDNWDKGWKAVRESLRSTLVEMLKDMAKYFAKMAAYQAVMTVFSGMFTSTTETYGVDQYGNKVRIPQAKPDFKAKGGVYKNGLQTFAKGGIVGQPTFFNTRSGKGLMGEAGPEAIVPLKRDRNGNLGVTMQGAGNNYSSTIIINAESGTAQVKSDANYDALAKSLDQQIRGVVLSTLVREKKPGGLLA